MIYEINKTDSEKLPLKSLQPKSKARSLYPWLFQSLSKPQVYLVTRNKGVCRVHGGGFAGTIQAFVEDDYVETYKTEIEKYFGEGSCHILKVRKYGGKKVEL